MTHVLLSLPPLAYGRSLGKCIQCQIKHVLGQISLYLVTWLLRNPAKPASLQDAPPPDPSCKLTNYGAAGLHIKRLFFSYLSKQTPALSVSNCDDNAAANDNILFLTLRAGVLIIFAPDPFNQLSSPGQSKQIC